MKPTCKQPGPGTTPGNLIATLSDEACNWLQNISQYHSVPDHNKQQIYLK